MSDRIMVDFVASGGQNFSTWAVKGDSLWSVMASNGVEIQGSCGGQGTCNKCRIRVEGEISKATQTEKENLNPGEIKRGIRLACHALIEGPAKIYLEEQNVGFAPVKNHLIDFDFQSEVENEFSNREVFVPGLEKERSLPFYERVLEALHGMPVAINLDNLVEISRYDRPGRPMMKLNAVIHRNQTVHVALNRMPLYGIALDLGTTTLFAALVNLETGELAGFISRANSQSTYGEDIVSRISYAMQGADRRQQLQDKMLEDINAMVTVLLQESRVEVSTVFKLAVAANPVILHFLLGLNPEGFAQAPYSGIFRREFRVPAYRLGIKANSQAEMIILPQIGGFVGADAFACLFHLEKRFGERFLMVDIGTNGEIVLNDRGRFYAASAAAGPAFEGGAVRYGMRGETGAIDKVHVDDDGRLKISTIGHVGARGLCGSGIIDLVSALLRADYIDSYGTFTEKARDRLNLRDGSDGQEFIVPGTSSIVFSQQDIRQVQLAKSAIRTAIDILLKTAGLAPEVLDKAYLAGAFGNYIDPLSAIDAGIFPPELEGKIVGIGNAAAKGAVRALCAPVALERVKETLKEIHTIELASREDFQDLFIGNLNFANKK